MKCPQTTDAGVYVLGALAPADRSQYERHLAGCAECRSEVSELAGLPGLLGRLGTGTAASIGEPGDAPPPAPPALLDSVLRAADAERFRSMRRRRWRVAGAGLAAACLVAVLAIVGVSALERPATPRSGPVVAQMSPIDPDVPIVALLGYEPSGGGTDISMMCLYGGSASPQYSDGWMVRLVVYPRGGGQPLSFNPWRVQPGQDASGWQRHVAIAPSEIARIELDRADGDGERLLVYQPA